jgi:hypothetical protein
VKTSCSRNSFFNIWGTANLFQKSKEKKTIMQDLEHKKVAPQWPPLSTIHCILWNQRQSVVNLHSFSATQNTKLSLSCNTCFVVRYSFEIKLFESSGNLLNRHRLYIFTDHGTTDAGELPFDVKQVTTATLEGYLGTDMVYNCVSKSWISARLHNLLESGVLTFDPKENVFKDLKLPECPSTMTYMSLL